MSSIRRNEEGVPLYPNITVAHAEDMDEEGGLHVNMSTPALMIAGAAAGVTEHVCMYPVDTIKTRMQALQPNAPVYRGVPAAFRDIVATEGFRGIYRGMSAVIAGAIPSHALYFAVYEYSRKSLGIAKHEHHPLLTAVCGTLATASHDAVITPLDVVKQRLQLYHSAEKYRGTIHCARSILRTEGLGAFFVSYPTTLAMNVPYTVVHFALYESSKLAIKDLLYGKRDTHSPVAHFLAGGLAGSIASAASTPLDVVKTRLQTQGDVGREYRGFMSVVRDVMAQDGWRGFFRGVTARMLYTAPSAAICWTTYEWCKHVYVSLYGDDHDHDHDHDHHHDHDHDHDHHK